MARVTGGGALEAVVRPFRCFGEAVSSSGGGALRSVGIGRPSSSRSPVYGSMVRGSPGPDLAGGGSGRPNKLKEVLRCCCASATTVPRGAGSSEHVKFDSPAAKGGLRFQGASGAMAAARRLLIAVDDVEDEGQDGFFCIFLVFLGLSLVLDYNDQKNIPYLREWIESINKDSQRMRDSVKGEEGNQDMYVPAVVPKVPGRFYYLFGKPIKMKRMNNVLRDRKSANEVYLHIKSEVENAMSYLKRKREEDPYRSISQRAVYQATWGVSAQVPTFEP